MVTNLLLEALDSVCMKKIAILSCCNCVRLKFQVVHAPHLSMIDESVQVINKTY